MASIGPYTLHAIEAGRLHLDGGAMFGVIPKPLWARRIEPDGRNRIPLNTRCLLLEGDDRLVLIDNGVGDKYDEKFADIYAIDQQTDNLRGNLAEAGFSPEDVTDVILSHLHFDHCGGSTYRDGGQLHLTFPNATHHVQRAHWHWANEPNARERASFMAENLEPLEASGQLNLLDGAQQLLPGVEVRPVYGHTEAQQVVLISDAERTLAFVADLLPTHHHLAPAWTMGYDVRPLQTMEEKASFLQEALDEGWHLFFEHDHEVEVADLHEGARGPETTAHRTLAEL